MNPVTSYGFTPTQASLGGMGRTGYPGGPTGPAAAMAAAQRPSFAIQELLGLGASQLGTGQTQGFHSAAHQLFQNESPNSGAYPAYQNFAAAAAATSASPPMQPPSMAACHGPTVMETDFGAMNAMYNPSWRSGLISNHTAAAVYHQNREDPSGLPANRSLCGGSDSSSLSPNEKMITPGQPHHHHHHHQQNSKSQFP